MLFLELQSLTNQWVNFKEKRGKIFSKTTHSQMTQFMILQKCIKGSLKEKKTDQTKYEFLPMCILNKTKLEARKKLKNFLSIFFGNMTVIVKKTILN